MYRLWVSKKKVPVYNNGTFINNGGKYDKKNF